MKRDLLFKNEEAFITQVIEFFFASILRKEHFEKVVATCLQNPEVKTTARRTFIQNGDFSLRDFLHYHTHTHPTPNGEFKNLVLEELLRRFCTYHLLQRSDLMLSFGIDYYHVNQSLAKFLLDRDALENLVFDFSHLVEKYAPSTFHLVVKDKNADIWNGTGFLCIAKNWVLTNKHIIEEDVNQNPRVLTSSGQELPVKQLRVSTSNDLALIELQDSFDGRPLYLLPEADPLTEIVTMGYPRIPLSKNTPLVAHKGEINGYISLTFGERLLFSAKTAPGNSGGPLLNRAGLVVGIVTEDLQSEAGQNKKVQPYFTAIPTAQIAAFLREQFPNGKDTAK